MKRSFPGEALMFPAPLVLLSAGALEGPRGLMTVSWAGTVCTEPPIVAVGVRPDRYTHSFLTARGEFALSLPTRQMLEAVDLCGALSGRSGDKFEACGLTAEKGEVVGAPLVAESAVNLECKLRQALRLGSHDLFLGEVVRVHVAEGYRRGEGVVDAVVYAYGKYYGLTPALQKQGFTVHKAPIPDGR